MPLALAYPPLPLQLFACAPARRAVLSWNSGALRGSIDLRVRFTSGEWSPWMPYVEWDEGTRRSHSPAGERVRINTDVVESDEPFDAVETRLTAAASVLALATPPEAGVDPPGGPKAPLERAVPEQSQYVVEGERGWCSPASLTMLLHYHRREADVVATAAAVYDDAYGGTGNWTMNVAYAARSGLSGFVAYLRNLDHARLLLAAGMPLALSIAWREGALEGAPLPSSDGHIVVLRGFDERGDPIVNDPAAQPVRRTYDRAQFARAWLEHGGVAYVLVRGELRVAVKIVNA